jgi:hypothetical protein
VLLTADRGSSISSCVQINPFFKRDSFSMRKLLTFLIASIFSISVSASSFGGSLTLLGVGGPAVALSPVTLTYQVTANGGQAGSTLTFGTITIGASPSSNRRVVVIFGEPNFAGNSILSATFTPNAGSPVAADTISVAGSDSTTGMLTGLVSAVLPVGTTTTLTVTCSASTSGGTPRFSVYTVDNSTLSSPTAPTSSFVQGTTSPITGTINTLSGGGLLALFTGFGTTTEGWTAGVTSDGVFGTFDFGHLSNTTPSTPLSVTNTWTVSGSGNPDIALWVYR